MSDAVAFCTAARVALGNLQRITNIASALAERRPDLPLQLVTNSERGADWARSSRLFREYTVADRKRMAETLLISAPRAVVVGVLEVPGIERVEAPLCLVLREVMPEKLARFRLAGDRPWDLVVLANPEGEWTPDPALLPARRVEAVGWIYRAAEEPGGTGPSAAASGERTASRQAPATVLVASGGGSADAEHEAFTREISELLLALRAAAPGPVRFVQAVGPHAEAGWRIPGVDEVLHPGPELHRHFATADLVISTAGYNSVLELASCDVPTLLVPIGRYTDDQYKRAEQWGPRVGRAYTDGDREGAARWMAATLARRERRAPADLGPSGAAACAKLIEDLLDRG